MEIRIKVQKDTTLKELLLENNFSNRQVSKLLLEKKDVYINDTRYDKEFNLKEGDIVSVLYNENTTVKEVDKDINIVFEDEYLLVVNKPTNLATIPSIAHFDDNLAARVLYYFNKHNINSGVHVINRLDYSTSGLVVFAKNSYVHSLLSKEKITKKYYAVVSGILDSKSGVLQGKIAKTNNGIKREISESGQTAITEYNVIKEDKDSSLVDITLKTGRTHQIRVHFSSINHPLVGDDLYGGGEGEYFLCSYYLAFNLSLNNKRYEFTLPVDIKL